LYINNYTCIKIFNFRLRLDSYILIVYTPDFIDY
jgi:hypothetical protein